MAGSVSREGDEPVAQINVTPLVDVMLVLLVIFMVTAPMLQQGVEVRLPKTTTGPLQGKSEQIVLSITEDGKIFLGAGNEIAVDNLAKKLNAVFENRPAEDRKIYIKADRNLNYGHVMEVMGALHQGGITDIGLVSAPGESKPEEKKATNKS